MYIQAGLSILLINVFSFHSALYQDFIDANRVEDLEMRMLKLKRLIHKLPEHHFETFKHLAEHLSLVASYGNMNKVCERNRR